MMSSSLTHFDVIIVGAGPAGCTTALKLASTGLTIAILEKSTLSKEKVCGDALSGTVLNVLKRMSKETLAEFLKIEGILPSWGIRFVAPGKEILDVPFVPERTSETAIPGVTCKRLDFEKFLIGKMKMYPNIVLFPETSVKEAKLSSSHELVEVSGDQFRFTSKVVVGADGLNSCIGKQFKAGNFKPAKICLGARGYYKSVTGLHPENYIELHFLKELLPNYLWIFPMHGGIANVGLGMMPGQIRNSHLSPEKMLDKILSSDPVLKNRFSKAALCGRVETHGLPMGSGKNTLSGSRFLLTGDAASLVDPFTGEGIGNAMMSGEIAARFIQQAFQKNDFSGSFFKEYDIEIRNKMEKEFKTGRMISKLACYPWLFNFVVRKVNKNDSLKSLFCTMYTDLESRQKLTNPRFYLRMVTEPLKTSSW